MQKSESLKNYGNNTYSLGGVMEYLNEQIQMLTEKEASWESERSMLLRKITALESEVNNLKGINAQLMKKMKHRRTSSEQKTFIFNQTNISSYYPILMMNKASWTCKKNLRSHLDSVRSLAWHNDYLLTSGEDCMMKVWRFGQLVSTIRQHLGPVYTMTTHKDTLYTAGSEGVVREWNLTGIQKGEVKRKAEREIHSDVIWELNHHKSLPALLSSGADGIIQLFKTSSSVQLQHQFTRRMNNGEDLHTPTSLDWLNGDRFITAYADLTDLVTYDIHNQKIVNTYKYSTSEKYHQANKILYNEYNSMIMSAHEDKMIRLMDPMSNKIIKSIVAHTDSVTCITFNPKSYEFSSSSHDGSVRTWDIRKFKIMNQIPVHCKKYDEAANVILQHETEMMIAVGGADGIVKVLYESD